MSEAIRRAVRYAELVRRGPKESNGRSLRYVLPGAMAGVAYAVLNTSLDYLHGRGFVARAFVALHNVVDDVIPVIVGALLGMAVHYVRLRAQVAREDGARLQELRARVKHVERDHAVWVVSAAALHELKNPLHSIGLLVDELDQTGPDDPEGYRALCARMRSQMDRALVPLEALRALARARRGHREVDSVVEVAERVVLDLAQVIGESGVDLRIEGSAAPRVRADPSFVRIILENLIGNSLDGLRQGTSRRERGRICVRLEDGDDQMAIIVSDDGPGLAPAAERALFHPLETAKDGGLGLGLSISRALARAMNGDLTHVTLPGWSTTFKLTLPIDAP